MSDRVTNALSHPVQLDDGRFLAPFEQADDIDLASPRIAGMVEDGTLISTSPPVQLADLKVDDLKERALAAGHPEDEVKGLKKAELVALLGDRDPDESEEA
jgi:hypothetical protein